MKTTVAALFGAVLLLAGAARPAVADPPLTVAIKSCDATKPSSVLGSTFGGPMRQFLGIPYAAPPTGKNRWMPPKPFCWGGERTTQTFGNFCPQNGFGNEDCLVLNVFTPATGTVKKMPVMVWIHGGALIAGAGSFAANPVNLVEQGVIVVSINYRLGALGFLAHPALDSVQGKRTGNYGIQDQQAALQWVQSNITAFGGDPKNITIFGQSAGGLSVAAHLVSPLSNNLFHKAIMESAAIGGTPTLLATAESQGQTFASNVGCSGTGSAAASCLRGKDVATILSNQSVIGQSTALLRVDDLVLKKTLVESMSAGEFKKVPIINGSTHDEMRFHLYGNASVGTLNMCTFTSTITPGSFQSAMQANGFQSGAVTAYSSSITDDMTANAAFTAAGTDRNFACPIFRASTRIAQHWSKIFAYEFNDANSPQTQLGTIKLPGGTTTFPYKAYHGVEGQYVFHLPGMNSCGPYPDLSSSQKKLAAAMVTYWTTFAKTGDPNPTDAASPPTPWPAFKAGTGKLMSMVASKPKAIAASSFDGDHKCSSFWNGFGG